MSENVVPLAAPGAYYLLYRGWHSHPMFGRDPFCRRSAWTWMIEAAAFAPHEIQVGGHPFRLERGQFCHSLRFMATAWRWDLRKVQRFLNHLKSCRAIATASATGTATGQTVVTILNYSRFQAAPKDEIATANATDADAKVPQRIKKEKEGKNNYAFSGRVIRLSKRDYDTWASAYPHIADLRAALQSRDDYLATLDEITRKKWFPTTSRWLQTENEKAAQRAPGDRARRAVPAIGTPEADAQAAKWGA